MMANSIRQFWSLKSFPKVSKHFIREFPRCSRYLSTGINPKSNQLDEDMLSFESALPRFKNIVLDYVRQFEDNSAANWFEKCMNHHLFEELPGRGVIIYYAYKNFAMKSDLTEENLELARYVGWCHKLNEGSFLLTDDIVDKESMRGQVPCWHTLPGVDRQVANDIALLVTAGFSILERIVGHKEYYPKLLKILMDGTFSCYLGQTLDYLSSQQVAVHQNREVYDRIVLLKACHYSVYHPIATALTMSGCDNPFVYEDAKKVTYEIGRVWAARNDYLQFFHSNKSVATSDLRGNKFTWLLVTFIERATPKQINMMKECYGKDDPEKIEQVKLLLEQIGIKKLFSEFLEKTLSDVNQMIESSPYDQLKPVLRLFRDNIFFEYDINKSMIVQ